MDWNWLVNFDDTEPAETPLTTRQRAFLLSVIYLVQDSSDWISGDFDEIEAFVDNLLGVLS